MESEPSGLPRLDQHICYTIHSLTDRVDWSIVQLAESAPQLDLGIRTLRAAQTRPAYMLYHTLSNRPPWIGASCNWPSRRHSWILESEPSGLPRLDQHICYTIHSLTDRVDWSIVQLAESAPQLDLGIRTLRAAQTRPAYMLYHTLSNRPRGLEHRATGRVGATAGSWNQNPQGCPD